MIRKIYLFFVSISGMELLKKPLEFSVMRTIMLFFVLLMR